MLSILTALAPVFAVILLGTGLKRTGSLGDAAWSGLEHLAYYLLFPALILRTVATADFSSVSVLGLLLGFLGALAGAALVLIAGRSVLKRLFGLEDAAFTSLFQACTRWNGYMALAMVTAIYGPAGVPVVAVALAGLVPAINMLNVLVLLRWGDGAETRPQALLSQLARNPFIIACGTGALLNATGLGVPEPVQSLLKTLGDATVAVSLLTVGASLRPFTTGGEVGAVVFGMAFRLVLMPVLFFASLTLCGVTGTALAVGTVCGAVPTAPSAYVLARKLGGDAPLMANMITAHVLGAAVTLPLVIYALSFVVPG